MTSGYFVLERGVRARRSTLPVPICFSGRSPCDFSATKRSNKNKSSINVCLALCYKIGCKIGCKIVENKIIFDTEPKENTFEHICSKKVEISDFSFSRKAGKEIADSHDIRVVNNLHFFFGNLIPIETTAESRVTPGT